MIQKHPKETSIDEDANAKSREIVWSPFFGDFKMSMFRLKYPGFLNKNNPHSTEIFRLAGLNNILINV